MQKEKRQRVFGHVDFTRLFAVFYWTFSFEYMDPSSGPSLVHLVILVILVILVVFDSLEAEQTCF